MDFILCVIQYLVEMAVLIGLGILGAFAGIKLRKKKNAGREEQE